MSVPFSCYPASPQAGSPGAKEISYFFSPDPSVLKEIKVSVCQVRQVHGRDLLVVNSESLRRYKEPYSIPLDYDGMMTHIPGILLIIYSADCLPLLFFEERRKIVAAVHAGWRGSFLDISGETIKKICEIYQGDPGHIWVACGPSIHACCFEIKEDVSKIFYNKFSRWEDLIEVDEGKQRLDLHELNRRQLIEQGVPEEHIIVSNVCTCCNPDRFPSYRRSREVTGRIVSGIMLT